MKRVDDVGPYKPAYPFWSEIRDKIADAQALLPLEASQPNFDDTRGAVAFALIAGLTWERDSAPQMGILTRLAEDLADRIRYILPWFGQG